MVYSKVTQLHVHLDTCPPFVPTGHWVEVRVLYRRFLSVTRVIHSKMYMCLSSNSFWVSSFHSVKVQERPVFLQSSHGQDWPLQTFALLAGRSSITPYPKQTLACPLTPQPTGCWTQSWKVFSAVDIFKGRLGFQAMSTPTESSSHFV